MDPGLRGGAARLLLWLVRRNPTYLISAMLVAAGVRMLLVDADASPGGVGLILATLGILQLYEWVVSGLLIVLHRWGRSPEDKPSLMLVAAVFWTGPLAATAEMIVLDPQVGASLAAGAGILAIGEMRLTCRWLGLRFGGAAQIQVTACMALTAGAPLMLRIPESGPMVHELWLLAAWCALAAICLLGIIAVNAHRRRPASHSAGRADAHVEMALLAVTAAAVATQLVGMNHAFYAHAAPFYASPLIIVAAIVGMEWLAFIGFRRSWLFAAFAALPVAGIALGFDSYDMNVPLELLSSAVHEPLPMIAALASMAWWYAFYRHRMMLLCHAGSAAFMLALSGLGDGEFVREFSPGTADAAIWPAQQHAAVVLTLSAAYLVVVAWWRRSRREAVVAMAAALAALAMWTWERTASDKFIITCAAAWCALGILHLASRRSALWVRLMPIVILAAAPWMGPTAAPARWQAAVHAGVLILALLAVGQCRRWTRYRSVAALLVAAHSAAAGHHYSMQTVRPSALMLIGGGFATLAVGALVSWHKARAIESLTRLTRAARTDPDDGATMSRLSVED